MPGDWTRVCSPSQGGLCVRKGGTVKLQRQLRSFLKQHFAGDVHEEPWCTCGSGNHVRIVLFRVNGQPATAIIPEGCELGPTRISGALPCAKVEPLSEAELDAIYAPSELGGMQPFENPFATSVYLDENLLQFERLVFCPKMFSGQTGECFRVPTKDFVELTQALVLRFFPAFQPAAQS